MVRGLNGRNGGRSSGLSILFGSFDRHRFSTVSFYRSIATRCCIWTLLIVGPSVAWAGPAKPAAAVPARAPYTLGVFPYVPPLTIDRIFGPVAVEFAKELDRTIHLKTKSTFGKFAQEMKNEIYDIIFVHPFFYLDATEDHDYLPLARLDENLSAVLMVPQGSQVRSLRDLAGRTVGLPPQLAAVSELVQASLIDAGLRPGTDVALHHYRTKMSCLQAVAIGAVAACGVPRFILSQVAATSRFNFEVMFETPSVDPFAFAIHARVPEAERRQLQQLIRDWCATDAGRAVLANGAWKGFVAIDETDYERARRYRSRAQRFAQH